MRALALLVVACCLPACPAAPPPQASGCGKDIDCKGDRICVERVCVAPAADTSAAPAAAPAAAPSDSAPIATAPTAAPEPSPPVTPPAPEPTRAPPPRPRDVSSGERPPARCGCAPEDALCALRCAQRDNPAAPPTTPLPTPDQGL